VKRLGQIERRGEITHEQFFNDIFQKQPIVMPGKISHWRALATWSPSFFRAQYGGTPVWLSRYDPASSRTFLEQNVDYEFREATMADYVDSLAAGDGCYSIRESIGLLKRNPELLEYLDCFRPFGCSQEPPDDQFMALWFAPKGGITGLHIDVGENLLFHLYGQKQVLIFAPDQTRFLYEEDLAKLDEPDLADRIDSDTLEMWRSYVRWSKINAFDPDFDRFPLLRDSTYLDAVIGPGDTLYIPCGWWHTVRSLDITISVSKSLFNEEFLRAPKPSTGARHSPPGWETQS
jgi:cupin-like protein